MSPQKIKSGLRASRVGFSLIETIMTMSIFMIIMLSVWAMIQHFGDVTKTENSRMNLQQTNRFFGSVMTEELRDAGSVLTLAHTGGFLATLPAFNGIYPLNNDDFPDGIIVAIGDPEAVTRLANVASPGSLELEVESATVPASIKDAVEYPPWQKGDTGIIVCDTAYYVFRVDGVNTLDGKITIRDWNLPVYASGQLNCAHYKDDFAGNAGVAQSYPKGSMVVRLTSFSIYLFDESEDLELGRAIRPFVRVTDTNGIANVLDPNATDVVKSVVSEDIWDLQISYLGYTAFSAADRETDPDLYYFAGTVKGKDTETIITTSTDGDQLLLDLKNRLIKQIDLNVVTLTGKFGGQGKADETLPIMGDRQVADQLPVGKYAVKISGFSVELRNFNGIL